MNVERFRNAIISDTMSSKFRVFRIIKLIGFRFRLFKLGENKIMTYRFVSNSLVEQEGFQSKFLAVKRFLKRE